MTHSLSACQAASDKGKSLSQSPLEKWKLYPCTDLFRYIHLLKCEQN